MKHTIKVSEMSAHPRSMQKVYNLNGIIHVPHYSQQGIYMSPGDKIGKFESYLVKRGAVEQQMLLWDRPKNDD
jgi:hypothetical protein